MRRIRVVYYSDAPYCGGAEYYLQVLALHLPRDRFEVRFILRPLEALERFKATLRESGIPVFEPLEPRFPDPGHWTAVYRHLKDVGADVLHVNLPGPYDARKGSIPVVGAIARVPVVTTEHLPMVRGSWRRELAKRLSTTFVDVIITVSDGNVGCLRRFHGVGRTPVRVVWNGVDPEVYRPRNERADARAELGVTDNEWVFATLGRLDAQKDPRVFLEAAREVNRSDPRARFLLIGDGPLRGELERRVDELDLGAAVTFLGHRKDVPRLLEATDTLVFSSIQEGMPFALLEAMAMEKPVVATDVFGLREVVREGETGRLVPAGDSRALSEAMAGFAGDRDRARAMGRRARILVEEKFSLAGMIGRTCEVYESLVGPSGPRAGGVH